MADRSLLSTVLGVPPWGAVGLAAVLTAVGVFVDLMRIGSLGAVFTVLFVSGCVLAVAWVRRGGLFGPMVQPPLLVAVAVPAIVLLAGRPDPGAGVAERLLVIGAPLVNAFPIMAWTTGGVLALGFVRIAVQRPLSGPVRRAPGERIPAGVAKARSGGDERRSTRDRPVRGKDERRPAEDRRRPGDDGRPGRDGQPGRGEPRSGRDASPAEDDDRRPAEVRRRPDGPRRPAVSERRPSAAGGARGEGRTSRSPRRS
jgi:hypothetical protein